MGKRKAKENILTDEEIKILFSTKMSKKEEFAYKILLFTGMRVAEAVHMQKNWIRGGKIHIPEKQKCNCAYCQQQFKRKLLYHKKMLKKFNSIKNPTEKQQKNWNNHCRTWEETKNNLDYWIPKSENAQRKILILEPIKGLLQNFFTKYDNVMDYISSPSCWRQIIDAHYYREKLDKKMYIKIFPHSLRSTFATIYYNYTRCNALELMQVMGWADLSVANKYVKTEMREIPVSAFVGE